MLVRAHCSIISVKSQGLCRFYEAGTDLGCLDRAGDWAFTAAVLFTAAKASHRFHRLYGCLGE